MRQFSVFIDFDLTTCWDFTFPEFAKYLSKEDRTIVPDPYYYKKRSDEEIKRLLKYREELSSKVKRMIDRGHKCYSLTQHDNPEWISRNLKILIDDKEYCEKIDIQTLGDPNCEYYNFTKGKAIEEISKKTGINIQFLIDDDEKNAKYLPKTCTFIHAETDSNQYLDDIERLILPEPTEELSEKDLLPLTSILDFEPIDDKKKEFNLSDPIRFLSFSSASLMNDNENTELLDCPVTPSTLELAEQGDEQQGAEFNFRDSMLFLTGGTNEEIEYSATPSQTKEEIKPLNESAIPKFISFENFSLSNPIRLSSKDSLLVNKGSQEEESEESDNSYFSPKN